ncbi:hypothetical protein DT076_07095 [Desertihabitans brevis]|uniref:ParB/Sulfiredoxin domain-containing protein n=1 Tax=Desertihabitans brevis TaxID=2268447 RepID=A0A367YXF1_9ACTN|nr:ParB N-terminal domain-containing protein [Desertihabitans brevis]RCK70407.1 hypothetical protein DT076_07095 [Desertihabitans brevis]
MPNFAKDELLVSSLKLDLKNPRMPDKQFASEEEALEFLVDVGSLEELVQSIALSGWVDVEPLIVLRETNEVIEGNRRLAALRLIGDPERAEALGISVPTPLHENAQPETVSTWVVNTRAEARDFIGFKHINGPFKWDSYAKARYAAMWLEEEKADVRHVARRLGDTHRTVARLINGYTVLRQAEALGFDREAIPGRFAFSHLYTALSRPDYRDFLGLPDDAELFGKNPVDAKHRENLTLLMGFLYGGEDLKPVIRSQNPDLKRLMQVLPNRTALAMLRANRNLDEAHAVVEDKGQLFADAVFALSTSAGRTSALIGNYEGGDDELEKIVESISRTVRSVLTAMREASQEANR